MVLFILCYNIPMNNIKIFLGWGLSLLIVILLFTGLDYFFHSWRLDWSVPEYYFRHKIIYGFLWSVPALILALLFTRIWQRALIFSSVIAIILQVKYYLEGYPLNFVLIFLLIHLAILFLLSLVMFRLIKFFQ